MAEEEKSNVKIICEGCGKEMDIIPFGDGTWVAHCMTSEECKLYGNCPGGNGYNSLIFTRKMWGEKIASHWLFEQFTEHDWRKISALSWLNGVWREFQQWCWDNQ